MDVGIFQPLAKGYCLERAQLQQIGIANIIQEDFLTIYKHARQNSESGKNIKITFKAIRIWQMNIHLVVKPVHFSEPIFMNLVSASDPP